MLMAIGGLFRADQVEWLSAMTYQAASGAGTEAMRELIQQMGAIANPVAEQLASHPSSTILAIDRTVTETMRGANFPIDHFGAPLAGSVLPWIDSLVDNGQSREEWKGLTETNKLLGCSAQPIPSMACVCVLVRCVATVKR